MHSRTVNSELMTDFIRHKNKILFIKIKLGKIKKNIMT
jgi:hypothetical protein